MTTRRAPSAPATATPTATAGEERFSALASRLLEQPGITRSTMMGYPCLRLHGDFFAACDRRSGQLVVKLDEARASALVEAGTGEPFAPNGHPFREWVSVPYRLHRRWSGLLDDALECSAVRQTGGRATSR